MVYEIEDAVEKLKDEKLTNLFFDKKHLDVDATLKEKQERVLELFNEIRTLILNFSDKGLSREVKIDLFKTLQEEVLLRLQQANREFRSAFVEIDKFLVQEFYGELNRETAQKYVDARISILKKGKFIENEKKLHNLLRKLFTGMNVLEIYHNFTEYVDAFTKIYPLYYLDIKTCLL